MPSSRLQCSNDRLRFIPSLTARVHRTGQSYDLDQLCSLMVKTSSHTLADVRERFEVFPFAREQRVRLKVRNHRGIEEWKASHLPLHRLVAAIRPECATPEVPLDLQQHLDAVAVLADRDTWTDLPSDPKFGSWGDRYRKATLTVDVSGDIRREIDRARSRARVLLRP